MLISQDERRLLGKIAFAGMWHGAFSQGEQIFTSLAAQEHKSIGVFLGLAQASMHKGDFDSAKTHIAAAAALDPQDEHVLIWQAMHSLAIGDTTDGRTALQDLQDKAAHADVSELATSLLNA
ncbi:MAG: hypothetical protein R3Y11_03340 [Pseudomonadota bacterium]